MTIKNVPSTLKHKKLNTFLALLAIPCLSVPHHFGLAEGFFHGLYFYYLNDQLPHILYS